MNNLERAIHIARLEAEQSQQLINQKIKSAKYQNQQDLINQSVSIITALIVVPLCVCAANTYLW